MSIGEYQIANYVGDVYGGSSTIDSDAVYNTATGTETARVPLSRAADLDAAVIAAQRAFLGWATAATPVRAQP